ncbi:maleylpyruvate isomerase N-terminal domain-containing protein [Saccharopolyspora sp. TS4A08]|uniref:Maleylpyruvate isomerase N-terminal domain-containing protein n=1 Tax=Saccharopolyspora ipomoeae TaxID=3042027 RepID=A0ABT6PSA5_9PSEU|nr:maleylpyruvate isomerase N-terminal domain-containing protein [Saccharopolyspora sp. TS4A08]MDI2030890.1 maleylpyruvate isomerase N-terminal domain-containing protein [Saccharopolyspora sp. TS4A08]
MIIDALEQTWQAWARLGAQLDDEQWARPTRLPSWTVKDVYTHVSPFPSATKAGIEAPSPDAPVSHGDAAGLLAFMQEPGGVAEQSAELLKESATARSQTMSTGELVAQFAEIAPQAVAELREADLERTVHYGGFAVVPAREALRIFVLEGVAHYLDIAAALDLDRPGPLAGEALRVAVDLLAETADPIAFIDAATGRSDAPVLPVMR